MVTLLYVSVVPPPLVAAAVILAVSKVPVPRHKPPGLPFPTELEATSNSLTSFVGSNPASVMSSWSFWSWVDWIWLSTYWPNGVALA